MNKIITPLRAEQSEDEPAYSFIYDNDGKYLFTVTHRYAAALIVMSEDAKRLELAAMDDAARITELEHALAVCWADSHWISLEYFEKDHPTLCDVVRNIRKWSGKHKAALAAGGDGQ